ncbi:hypothetical protein [Dysgonomonas sp. 521]|uniref:hypothetical protein n=1 Tax=Dysgonomonas sp. 521 TaxID=2302932 RepID=UPI0013D44066|nr:hypothetical protein [Dysgonomonas sp. 521]
MEAIENNYWAFKSENMDLFNGIDTPLNKDYEFCNLLSKLLIDSVEIKPIHEASISEKVFTIRFFSNNACHFKWTQVVPDVVTGKSTASFLMTGEWKIKGDNMFISYECLEFRPVPMRGSQEYVPAKYTHICKLKYKIGSNDLILTPVEVETISE